MAVQGVPAPKLREARLSCAELTTCYWRITDLMRRLYTECRCDAGVTSFSSCAADEVSGCRLVHADLSEYNVLYHNGEPHIIDVGQAVDTQHQRAREYLYNDCRHITDFFQKVFRMWTRILSRVFISTRHSARFRR